MPLQRLVSRRFRVTENESNSNGQHTRNNNNSNDDKFQLFLKVGVLVDYYDKLVRVRHGFCILYCVNSAFGLATVRRFVDTKE